MLLQSNSSNGPELYHPVIRNTPYRLWNPASTSLLQRDSNNVIRCNGSFKDMDYNSKFTIAENLELYGVKIASVFAWSFACNYFVTFFHNLPIALFDILLKEISARYPCDLLSDHRHGIGLARAYTVKLGSVFIRHFYNLTGAYHAKMQLIWLTCLLAIGESLACLQYLTH